MGTDRGACGGPGRRWTLALLAGAICVALFVAPAAFAGTFTVTSAADTDHGGCSADCTLRDAINAANASTGADTIDFNIGVGGSYTILPFSVLPTITEGVTIDASSQPGYAGAPLITIDNVFLEPSADGLTVDSSGSTIRGFAITHFDHGIVLDGLGHDTVVGNYLGFNGAVAGNAIGVGAYSPSNVIGGPNASDANVISGNTDSGIDIGVSGGNRVLGNFIGTDPSGTSAAPNGTGVSVTSNSNTIGEAANDRPNVISGNVNAGVLLEGASNNLVDSNYIGVDAYGTTALANGGAGIDVVGTGSAAANVNAGSSNVISGNGGPGILIETSLPGNASGADFEQNLIGTDFTGQKAIGNAGPGIELAANGGAGGALIRNSTIAYNATGIVVGANNRKNEFFGNLIHDNAGPGIDLGDDGPTPNDPDDADSGANDLINTPVITSVSKPGDGSVEIKGTYDGIPTAGLQYRLEFFTSPSCDASGFGEGATFLGTTNFASDANGDFTFDVFYNASNGLAPPGSFITATATDQTQQDETSEFSACKQLPVPSAPPLVVTTTAAAGPGSLHDAIAAANAAPGTDTITFNLPDPPFVIQPTDASELPAITDPVIIDGNTQPGTTPGSPKVQLDGSLTTAQNIGLDVASGFDPSTIRGLSITNFGKAGLLLEGAPSIVEGSYLGITPGGAAAPNGNDGFSDGGIVISSGANTVGGTTGATRNVISGNKGQGIQLGNESGNVIIGNRIGTDPTGTTAVPNTASGIRFEDVSFQFVGGTAAGAGNLISGNGADGIFLNSGYEFETARFEGNVIGLAADGKTPLPNAGSGINAQSVADVHIGGAVTGAGNVISGNDGVGVNIVGGDRAVVQGNLIGLTADGLSGAGNANVSGTAELDVQSSSDVLIGGTTPLARNVISGHATGADGVVIAGGTHNSIQGNYIGTDATGQNAIGNGEGVQIDNSDDNTVGGAVPGAGNVISGSNGAGVDLFVTGTGDRVLGNSIGTNAGETAVLGNDVGVQVELSSGERIGSTSPGAGNVIAGSDDTGVLLIGDVTTTSVAGNFIGTDRTNTRDLGNGTGVRIVNGTNVGNLVGPSNVIAHSGDFGIEMDNGSGNRFSSNSIHDNGAEGIHLAGGGANNGQTSPTLTTATFAGSTTTVAGTLASAASTTYFVEYFSTPSCSGQPQGQTYLGSQTVATDGGGNAFLNFQSGVPAVGDAITATATNASTLDTSAFSACATVTNGYVVNTADDHADITGCTVSDCSLREAIGAANAAAAPLVEITFAIPGGGPQQIAVTEVPLPDITTPVVIDGTTESGVPPGTMGITLNGDGAGAGDGLVLAPGSKGSTIRGLAIRDFAQTNQAGIRIQSDGNTIAGDYIGTTADGTNAGSNYSGVLVEGGNGNVIGGSTVADRNVISGNQDTGVLIDGTASGASGNVVSGNYIGVNATGQTALANVGDPGVWVRNASNNVIGGSTPADGNVIANNFNDVFLGDFDVATNGTSNQVEHNLLGLTADQTISFPNSGNGVEVQDTGSNVVSNNTIASEYQGIDVCGSGNNIVSANTIGSNASLVPDFGVFNQGISILDTPCFSGGGSGGPATGNVVSTNVVLNSSLNGIAADSNLAVVATNTVTNTKSGAAIESSGTANRIGPDNSVHNNAHDGVLIDTGTSDTITRNSIDGNGGKGISLVNFANDGQSPPALASANLIANGSVRIQGTLTSDPNRNFRIEYFASSACDASGSGEGATFIGFSQGSTDGTGTLPIDTGSGLSAHVAAGSAVTATTTDTTSGTTSEFSTCVTATDAAQTSPFVVNTSSDHPADGCTIGDCTLREAITAAAAAPGSAIHFDLPSGQTTIAPASNLPIVSAATTIDAATQPGYSGTPLVTLTGTNVSSNGIGFNVTGDGSTIRGFVITDWNNAGIDVNFSNGNTIAGNYIGIDVGGIGAQNGDGILLDQNSDNNTIGGTGLNDRNVISANGHDGILLTNGEGGTPDNNTIVGNYIGLRPDGTGTQGVSGNVSDGVEVAGDSNTIGGSTAAARNYVSGNDSNGITIFGQGNAVKGNVVGLDVSGNPLANSSDGIDVDPFVTDLANVIGGPGAGDGNVISGNSEDGLFLQSPFSAAPPGTIVRGNLIGTDPSGTTAIGNGLHGIETNDGAFNQIDHNTISGNLGDGIYSFGFDSNNNTISQNKIGTNSAGTAALPNQLNGVEFDESSGTASDNVISGNLQAGVVITGPEPPSTFTTVTGNKIGTNAAGTAAIANDQGIVDNGGVLDIIGGTAPGDGNLISGNTEEGVVITAFANFPTLEGNTIGLNAAGTAALPNATGVTVSVQADTVTIGGSTAGARNIISGNTGTGIFVNNAGGDGGVNILGNFIGTDATGTAKIGNAVGIDSKDSNGITIGQNSPNAGNVIAGSSGTGVHIEGDAAGNLVEGNFIGTDLAGALDLGNQGDGVHVGPLIHGTIVRLNTVEHNGGAGVAVPDPNALTIITQNSIDRNGGLGIDLGPTGVTANDAGDSDGFQNFPTLTSVSTTTVSGTLSSTGNLTYNVDLYLTPVCDPSGNGEGLTFLGTTTVSTDDGGSGSFTANVPALPAGQFVTATAQNLDGGTSEFSACLSTVQPPIATNLTLTPSSGTTPAGAARVQLGNVPPSVFLQPQSTNQAAPVNDTPVNDTPVNDLPVNDLPVNDLPVNDLGFDDLAKNLPALGDTALSSIPLLRPGGWTKVLSDAPGTPLAGLPLQSVTLRDYYRLGDLVPDQNPETRSTNRIAPITLADLDLTHSPLGSLPASAIVLANVKLSWLRPLGTWCTLFGATYCSTLNTTNPGSDLADTTVMAAAIQGAPVNDTPVNDTPVNDLPVNDLPTGQTPVDEAPVNDLPVNDTPVNDLPVNDTPVNDTPVNDLPVNDTPVNDLPVNDLMVANSTLGHTPVNDLPVNDLAAANTVVVCAAENPTAPNRIDCTSAITLKQAFDQHAIRPGITLKDLRAAAGPSPNAFDGISIGDLHYWGNVTIKGLVDSLPPNTMTLGDYFLLVLRSPTASQGLAWEQLNLSSGLSQYSTNGSTVDYRAHFTVQPNGGPSGVPSPMTVKVTLGDGFLYESGTSRLVQDPATCSPTAPSIPDPNVTPLPNGQLELKWGITATVGSSYSICLTSRPGIELGPQASSIDATPVGGTTGSATGGTVDVGDTNEPNNNADATAPELFDNSFYLSYLTSSDDVDYYRFKAPAAGTIVTFHLSHLPADYDLVVYGPPETPLRPSIAGTMPLDEPPVTDSGADLTHQTDALPSQTLDDLELQPNMPLAGVSASRGKDPEDIVAVSPGGSGYYTIQVTGYNGATSPDPYMLRVATRAPRPVSPVPARTITGTAGPALPTTLPTGLNTVFLVNRKQLEGTYGSTGATNVMSALTNDSTRFTTLGFPNVTLSVDNATNDTGGAVAAAYAQWNAHPGDPAAANGVVKAINAMVDSKIRSQPNGSGLKYLVIVGGDQIIPFARLDDFTITSANESTYANTFSQGTDLFSALNLSQMLSDDPYATTAPVPYLTRQLYVPNLSVGRLVETPDDIIRTLNNFVSLTVNGVLNPTTSLTTGYDFLYDSATTINGYMRSRFSATTANSLLDNPATRGDTWSLTQLIGAFVPLTAATPSITSLNGHASHYQFQAPTDDAGARGGILTTATLAGATTSYNNRLVFSMGCHAGLSVADSIVTAAGASTLDWPQTFAQKGAGSFLGNTGYGYGDTLVTAYSEELNRLFAQNIAAGAKVGNALVAAKQAYFAELGVFGVYDEKAMAEFTLYGLPMWGVANASGGTGTTAALTADSSTAAPASATTAAPSAPSAPPTANAVITDPGTGLQAETFSVNPSAVPVPGPPALNVPTYWTGNDGVQVTHLRPIQPKSLVGLTGTSAHGALITGLSSTDTNCVTPAFDRPVFDLSANEPALTFADLAFPSKIQTVRTFETPSGRQQQLVLVTGQYFAQPCTLTNPNIDPTPPVGVQRLFGHIAGRVFRSSSTDFAAPVFKKIDAVQVGTSAAFTVNVTGNVPASDSVKQVIVGVRSGSASVWSFVTLAQSAANPTRWTGGAPVSGTNQFEYFVQAVDGNGNVAVSTNKGFYFVGAPAPQPPTGGIETALTGPKTNGWFTAGAGLTIDPIPGVVFDVSIDGGTFARYNPQAPPTITGDGFHTADIRASNGGTAELFVPVDTTAPELVVNTPANGGTYILNSVVSADYFCRDSGSGVTSPCTVRLPNGSPVANGDTVDTSTPGPHTLTVDPVTDAAGHTTPGRTVTYNVGYRPILFASARTGGGDIYSMNPDGTAVTRLTTASALDEQPAWSPDGTKIAFASARNATKTSGLDIYVMDANGQNVTRLTTATGDDTAPSWSPDGRKIAFQSNRDGNTEIYSMNADGSAQTRLTNDSHPDTEPAWAPNGTRIAFVSSRNVGLNIWTMKPDGTGLAQLTAAKQPEIDPAWSPDSSRIIFSSNRAGGSGYDLWVMSSTNGSNLVRLTSASGDDDDPVFSRDGRKVAFTSNRMSSNNQDIYVANADGTGATRLTTTSGYDHQPDW